MQVPMLTAKTSRFEKGVLIRKGIFLIISIAALVCAVLGSLYYQLLLNKGFDALIAWSGVLLIVILTILSKLLSRKDDYKRVLSTVFVATNPDEVKQYKNLKQLVQKCEEVTKEKLKGYMGYKACISQNGALISYMTTGCLAFDKYAGGGFKTIVASLLLKFVLAPFKFFAIIDYILTGATDNNQNRIIASTKWYPRWQEYSKGILSFVASKVLPLIGWVILSAITASTLNSMLDVNQGIISLVWFGLLGIILQLYGLSGNRKVIIKITSDYTEKQIPQPDFNICTAFANISPEYLRLCQDCGFIQPQQMVEVPEAIEQGKE